MALRRTWIPSPNFGSRAGSGVRLVVVHTAEGARTYQELGEFFGSSSSGKSSHTGIDSTPGRIGEYVKRRNAAFTQANANPYSIATELCAFAEWSRNTWLAHDRMLTNCALWIREECQHYGLPIVKLSASQAQGSGRGVCGHVDLGAAGGGHRDPGPAFPWDIVIERAKSGGKPEPLVLRVPIVAVAAGLEADGMPPEYVVKDESGSDGKGSRYGVYPSGLVRELGPQEWDHVKTMGTIPVIENRDTESGTRLLNYDRALRGLVKERD